MTPDTHKPKKAEKANKSQVTGKTTQGLKAKSLSKALTSPTNKTSLKANNSEKKAQMIKISQYHIFSYIRPKLICLGYKA